MSRAGERAPRPGELGAGSAYTLRRLLGRGGFGEVWLAEHAGSGEEVAVKLLLPGISERDTQMERFEREIRTGAWMQHPHVVRVLDAGKDAESGRAWFAMGFSAGVPWGEAGLTLRGVLEVARQVLGALAWVHARGVVHRDIKPDNILVERGEVGPVARLLDFGIAFLADGVARRSPSSVTQLGAPMGTLAYMSPEQAAGETSSVGPASDLYALGISLFELVSGQKPFQGKGLGLLVKHCAHPPPPLTPGPGMPEVLPEGLEPLIGRLLAKPYGERPEFAVEVQAEVNRLLRGLEGEPWWGAAAEARAEEAPPTRPGVLLAPALAVAETVDSLMASAVERRPRGADPGEAPLAAGRRLEGAPMSLLRLRPAPLVGRAAAQQALQRVVQRVVRTRAPAVVAVRGAAGSGMTTLGGWLAELLHQHGVMRTLEISLVDHGALGAALRAALHRALRLPQLERRPLMERIGQVLDWRGEEAQGLADFLVSAEVEAPGLDGAVRWRELLQQRTAHPAPRPRQVWLDGAGRDAAAVARWVEATAQEVQAPVLFLWTDASSAPPLGGASLWDEVTLGRLEDGEVRELAAALVPGLAEEGYEHLTRQAAGNPLVAREVLLGWVERELLVDTPAGWCPALQVTTLPTQSPEQVLQLQLAALIERQPEPEKARWALEVLAFMGPLFPPEQAARALQGSSLDVEGLIRQGVLAARPSSREARVAFANATAQSLLQAGASSGGRAGAARLAAADVRIEGAVQALIQASWDTVEQSVNAALSVLRELEAPPDDERFLIAVEVLMSMLYRKKESSSLARWADYVLACSAQASSPSGAMRTQRLGRFWKVCALSVEQRLDEVLQLAEGLSQREDVVDHVTYAARHLMAQIQCRRGDLELSAKNLDKSYQDLKKIKSIKGVRSRLVLLDEADLVNSTAQLRQLQGDLQSAAALQRRILQIYREVSDPQGEAHALMALARSVRTLGDAAEAQRLLKRAQGILEALDDRAGRSYLAWEQGAAALKEERYAEAEAVFWEAQQLFTTIGDAATAGMCANGRGEAARKAGRLAEADGYYHQFFEVMSQVGYVHGQALALMNMGWTRLEAQQVEAAWGCFRDARGLLGEETPRTYRLMARIGLALTLHLRGAPSEAMSALLEAESVAEGHPVTDEDCQAALRRLAAEAQGELAGAMRSRAMRLLGERG